MTKRNHENRHRHDMGDTLRLRAARQFVDQAIKNIKLMDGTAVDRDVLEVLGQVIEEKKSQSRAKTKRSRGLDNEDRSSECAQNIGADTPSSETPSPPKKRRLTSPERIATPEASLPAPEVSLSAGPLTEEHSSPQLQFNKIINDNEDLDLGAAYSSFNETEAFPNTATDESSTMEYNIFSGDDWGDTIQWYETE